MNFASVGVEREVRELWRELLGEHASTERERCKAALFASGNFSAAVFSPTNLPISYMRKSAPAVSSARAIIAAAVKEDMRE
jgi:hypothetical protein